MGFRWLLLVLSMLMSVHRAHPMVRFANGLKTPIEIGFDCLWVLEPDHSCGFMVPDGTLRIIISACGIRKSVKIKWKELKQGYTYCIMMMVTQQSASTPRWLGDDLTPIVVDKLRRHSLEIKPYTVEMPETLDDIPDLLVSSDSKVSTKQKQHVNLDSFKEDVGRQLQKDEVREDEVEYKLMLVGCKKNKRHMLTYIVD